VFNGGGIDFWVITLDFVTVTDTADASTNGLVAVSPKLLCCLRGILGAGLGDSNSNGLETTVGDKLAIVNRDSFWLLKIFADIRD
jgi:hypothetical protein